MSEAKYILSDKEIRELTEYLPYPEGGGEDLADFETLSGLVEKAVSPYLKKITDPAQAMVFVFRAFYFLGALHGMQTYRCEVCGEEYLPDLNTTKFSLDEYSAIDFYEFNRDEVPPEYVDEICRKFGFGFTGGEDDEQ